MRTIWKYTLQITDRQLVRMPAGAQILEAAEQDGKLCLWALVDPQAWAEVREISIVGTGNPVGDHIGAGDHIGTAQIGPFVWHVFETTEEAF